VTAPGSGAEIIPFLKTWVNLPMAIGFTILYAQLANTLSTEALFYTCIIPFIIFFGCFAFVIYPARDAIHPTGERPPRVGVEAHSRPPAPTRPELPPARTLHMHPHTHSRPIPPPPTQPQRTARSCWRPPASASPAPSPSCATGATASSM
jgi:hypothetical protein